MNKVILMGRLTREPDVRYSQNADGSMAIARYTLAVDRRRSRNSGAGDDQQYLSISLSLYTSLPLMKDSAMPDLPARPVRPILCT